MKERWVLLRKGADFAGIGKKFHISPRLACLIRNRDIVGDEQIENYLYGTIADLGDGMLMKDMDRAVEILMEKIREGAPIRIIGDYDIDGVCATYILLEGLKGLGAVADTDIPDRITDGYGLNRHLIDRAFEAGTDTIITCDNGIAAAEEIAYGKGLGMTVIVTDHHEVPFDEEDGEKKYHLPPADAVVDPKRTDCSYSFKGLCGAAVAYKLMEALYEAMGKDSSDIDYLMEEVAFATVGDVMDLTGENRIFVRQGLEMLQSTSNLGLRALMECTGIDRKTVNTYHIGFVLGPCLNASGRLDTAKRALALLEAGAKQEADVLAGDLKALNDSRKEMTEEAVRQAAEQVEHTEAGRQKVLVLYLPDCHESLAGIVAGRIRERYCRPVFVITDSGEMAKGSGRSIEAYHMYEEMNKCRNLFVKFGGHKLAAGLTLKKENIEKFRQDINAVCTLTETDMTEKVSIDMQMPFSCVTEELLEELKLLEPFGKGNTKPVFAEKNVSIVSCRLIGKNRNMLRMRLCDGAGTDMDAVYFGDAVGFLEEVGERYGKTVRDHFFEDGYRRIRLSVTYYPGVNEYMGQKTMQIVVTHYQIV
ncbi:single-stranded-DNA-specific exonuclease RecJ [Lachnospiraceae bacterium DSM 108991]|uniref:Single-stranded-DNA-specific exonuclease RecJ n=1 Tax=Claveliimonas monacensis TaxID=2779351 RepID=A0ABR9RLJ1_9FIRM|nr:single-stranded-DNA-specific exonuclease RecJ [Claveliimonas monacensis]MBE5063848.1 single-stranded-DNA-specific exonuclease RecJ [Claveliimonas monacensis]